MENTSDDTPRNLDDARMRAFEERALENVEDEEIYEIIATVEADPNVLTADKAFASCVLAIRAGAQAAYIVLQEQQTMQGVQSTDGNFLTHVRQVIDDAVLQIGQSPATEGLVTLRKKVAAYTKEQAIVTMGNLIEDWETVYHVRAEVITDGLPATSMQRIAIGVVHASRRAEDWLGWLTRDLRPKLSCNCLGCLGNDFQMWQRPEDSGEQLDLIVGGGGSEEVVRIFGDVVIQDWRRRYQLHKAAAEDENAMDPTAANHMAQEAFAKMGIKPNV